METVQEISVELLDEKKLKDIEIGERIKVKRSEKGWSQTKLSETAGLSQGMISLMENKGEGMTEYNLEKIAAALNVAVSDLTGIKTAITEKIPQAEKQIEKQEEKAEEKKTKRYKSEYKIEKQENSSTFKRISESVIQRFLEENKEKIMKEIEREIVNEIRKTYF